MKTTRRNLFNILRLGWDGVERREEKVTRLTLFGVDGKPLLGADLNPRAFYVWHAPPGEEKLVQKLTLNQDAGNEDYTP